MWSGYYYTLFSIDCVYVYVYIDVEVYIILYCVMFVIYTDLKEETDSFTHQNTPGQKVYVYHVCSPC